MPKLPSLPYRQAKTPSITEGKTFYIISNFGELLDIAIWLEKVCKHKVIFNTLNGDEASIGKGIVTKETDWFKHLGKGYIWVIDGCENAELQDWLRARGESVVGTNVVMSELENDRQKGQQWFREAGFKQPESKNFKGDTAFSEAMDFITENSDKMYILKQNGSAPKHLNHKAHFEDGSDMLFHMEELSKSWNKAAYGEIDFDLMEVVEGTEIAASAFFNGHDFLRNKEGKVVGFLNFEEKKEANGNMGETTGETGTTFIGVDEDNEIFADIIMRPEIVQKLIDSDFRGVFDVNGSLTDEGYVAFEATSRFGIPSSSYEFTEGLKTDCGIVLAAMAMGRDVPVEVNRDVGMVIVVAAKPYPVEADLEDSATSIGQKLWIVDGGFPAKDFDKEQLQHIHLENFEKDDNGDYRVATKNGYLLTVTGSGKDIASVREELIEYIEDNIHIAGMKIRTDVGKRIEDFNFT